MFDFAWTQIGLIGVVALVLIGPKDLPVAIRTVAGLVKKARRMAGEFQSHVDEMVKDTELADIRNQISEIRNFDIRREVERAVDSDGSLRATLQQDPFHPAPLPPAPSLVEGGTPLESGHVAMTPAAPHTGAPAFVPPSFVPPEFAPAREAASGREVGPPAFVPPAVVPPAVVPSAVVPSAVAAPAGADAERATEHGAESMPLAQSRPAA